MTPDRLTRVGSVCLPEYLFDVCDLELNRPLTLNFLGIKVI